MNRQGILNGWDLERMMGVFFALTKTGPAARDPFIYTALNWIGVFQKPPGKWQDSDRLEWMPWGKLDSFEFNNARPPAGIDGLWPQPPIVDAGFNPPVLNVGAEERRENLKYNSARYLGQIVSLTPGAAYRALKGPRLSPVSDDKIADLFVNTSFAQFIQTQFDDADREAFANLVKEPEGSYAKLDFSAIARMGAPLPGISVSPTVSLLKNLGNGKSRFEAIKVGNTLTQPGDGLAWTLAKYFVIQGAQIHLVTLTHPRLHFPQDVINALTRTLLPQGHVLYKLLRPHGVLTLGLHEATIHHRRSVIHNSQREIYTPFPLPTDGIHKAVALGVRGVAGNSAYPAFRFGDFLPGTHTIYGRYRQDWFNAVLEFVSGVVEQIPRDDAFVIRWANHISEWLPGFPDGGEIFKSGVLAEAAAKYICAVSVFHTADHHSYSGIPLDLLPWRLRIPPPDTRIPERIDLDALVSAEDFFRHQLCHAMFFKPAIIRNLHDVDYGFSDPAAKQAVSGFRHAMHALDARWKDSTFPASKNIAVSLQY